MKTKATGVVCVVHVYVQARTPMCVEAKEESGQAVRYLPLQMVTLLAKNRVFHWTQLYPFGWQASSLELPISALPMLELQVHAAILGFSSGSWGFKLRSSCLHDKRSYPKRWSMKSYFYIKPSTSWHLSMCWVTRLYLFNWCASQWHINLNFCCICIP